MREAMREGHRARGRPPARDTVREGGPPARDTAQEITQQDDEARRRPHERVTTEQDYQARGRQRETANMQKPGDDTR